jgi:outer membrane protein OmpA-like peptidoglycan-associated protein
MNKKTLYLIGILLTIIIGSILYNFLCGNNCSINTSNNASELVTEPVSDATKNAFMVKDNQGGLDLFIDDNLNFKISSFNILEPVATAVNSGVLNVKDYLLTDSLKIINITGFYSAAENNISAFPDLGLARANAVKNYFVSTGIPSKKINTYGELDNNMKPDNNNIYYGPVSFSVSTLNDTDLNEDNAVITIGNNLREQPLVLYFDVAETSLNLTENQRHKIANLSRYIDKVEDAMIQIIGYTDNTGDRHSNIKLGQHRADFIKRYLVGNAIPESRIQASSQGPDNPIATNDTEEGRAKNRRVIVTIN